MFGSPTAYIVENRTRPIKPLLIVSALLLGGSGVAVPMFGDPVDRPDVSKIARVLSMDSAVNFAVRSQHPSAGVPVTDCLDVIKLSDTTLPERMAVTQQAVKPGTAATCQLMTSGGVRAEFVVHGVL